MGVVVGCVVWAMVWKIQARAEELPYLDDMVNRVFPTSAETARTEASIEAHFAKHGPGPRAGVVLLLKDLRCGGKPCKQNTKWGACTYLDQAVRSIGSLVKPGSLLHKYPRYPVLLYHSDWTPKDRASLETASGLGADRAFWHRVHFGPDSLPPYLYDANRTVRGWRDFHVAGDLARETKNNIHGFGYMLMCRLYAGLIHHAPMARRLDYYLRVDGDSRLSHVEDDPFAKMERLAKKYAHYGRGGYREVASAAVGLPGVFAETYPHFSVHYQACGGPRRASCPTVANFRANGPKMKAPQQCHLDCRLSVPENSADVPLPVPLCARAGGPVPKRAVESPRCPAFYNNFEIVDMRAFRTSAQWHFFLLAERAHVFLCEHVPGRSRPGKCGGGGMGDAMFRTIQVNSFLKPNEILHVQAPALVYKHPVPIAHFCGPKGTTDGGPRVLSIDDSSSSSFTSLSSSSSSSSS